MIQVPLTKGKFAIIDDEDAPKVLQHKWYYARGYAARGIRVKGKTHIIYLHHEILPRKTSHKVDHKNGDTLNNCRNNLRYATSIQNGQNQRRRHKGAHYHSRFKRWASSIRYNKKLIHLGYFSNRQEAQHAYNKKAIELFGNFACLSEVA